MSSILTNNSAMTALQTLRGINKNMNEVQTQVSTGSRVATAKENAAIWSVAAVMQSDVSGFKGVSDALSLGASTVAVARSGAETTVDLLNQMKERIVAAQAANVDRGKIDADVQALKAQIVSTVEGSQFNGANLLQQGADLEVLSGLNRTSAGVTDSSISVQRNSLEVSRTGNAFAGATAIGTTAGTGASLNGSLGTDAGTDDVLTIELDATGTIFGTGDGAGGTLQAGDVLSVSVGDVNVSLKLTQALLTAADAATVAENISNELGTELTAAFAATGNATNFTVDVATAATVEITNASGFNTNASITAGGGLAALADLDVTTEANAGLALAAIEGLIQTATDGAASFGSDQKRIETQQTFVKNLSDNLKSGIGALTDADMEEVSARLQALQVQQQLGVQSLSIANQQPQTLLSLFR